jgi:hypothetical protein
MMVPLSLAARCRRVPLDSSRHRPPRKRSSLAVGPLHDDVAGFPVPRASAGRQTVVTLDHRRPARKIPVEMIGLCRQHDNRR